MNNIDLNRIQGLAQSLGDKPYDETGIGKGNYQQIYPNGEIDNEMTIRLSQVENALDGSFIDENNTEKVEKGIELYELKKVENAINIFWKKIFPRGGLGDRYELWKDYDISDPRSDLYDLSKESNILVEHIILKPERKFLRFYIGKTEIFIKNKAFEDFMKIYNKESDIIPKI